MARRSTIGLDIGTSAVRAAELTVDKGRITMTRFGQVDVPVGSVRDGEVVDVAAVAGAIKKLWGQAGFKGRKVVLGVANQKVVVRQVDLPWLPEKELHDSLAYQVSDLIPMALDNAVLDFFALEEVEGDQGRVVRGMLVAAASDMVLASVEAARQAGLTAESVDLSSFAVLRALGAPDHLGMNATTEMIVEIGARVANILIHSGGVPRFVRVLRMGGNDLTEALAERLGIPFIEAQQMKHETGLLGDESQPGTRALGAATSSLVDEIRGSLDYYMASPGAQFPSRLVLSGGASLLSGLPERLAAATRLPVEAGDALDRVLLRGKDSGDVNQARARAAVPVGLALGAVA